MGVAVKREWIEDAKAIRWKAEARSADAADTSELRELLACVRKNLARMHELTQAAKLQRTA